MQLKKSLTLSGITAIVLASSALLHAENYVSVEYLQYDESDNRVSVSAPMLEVSYDFDTDYNLKASMMFDGISGATPSFLENANGDFYKGLQDFEDTRNAGALLLTSRLDNRDEIYTGLDFSRESDYQSLTASLEYMHYTDETHNTAISIGASLGFNELLVYDGVSGASTNTNDDDEYDGESGASHKEDSIAYNVQIGLTQVLTSESSVKVSAFTLFDDGYLTNPHGLVVRDYNSVNATLGIENRPDNRTAYGLTTQYNHALSKDISAIASYRFYSDDWDMTSHTLELDSYINLSKDVTLGVGLRYYTQTEANFYNENIDYFTTQKYASSDERLSKFDAFTYKASIDYKQNDTLSYNVGIQVYEQNTISNMSATAITVGVKYKF
jgi:hypothetical protein